MKYKEMPWSIEETIENLEEIKGVLQKRVIKINLHGKAEQDAKEVAFDFDRAIGALNKQIPKEVVKGEIHSQECPECGSPVRWKFCANCGQALKYGKADKNG